MATAPEYVALLNPSQLLTDTAVDQMYAEFRGWLDRLSNPPVMRGGKIVHPTNGHTIGLSKFFQDFMRQSQLPWTESVFCALLERVLQSTTLTIPHESNRDIALRFLRETEIVLPDNGSTLRWGEEPLNAEDLRTKCIVWCAENGDVELPPLVLSAYVTNAQRKLRKGRREVVRSALSHRVVTNPPPVMQLVDALKVLDDKEVVGRSLLHWAWQVKRRFVLGLLDTPYPIMISLFSRLQGIGKSWFTRKLLCGPLSDFTVEGRLDDCTEKFSYEKFTRNAIVIMDEIARPQNEEQTDNLKRIIACEKLNQRGMHSTTTLDMPASCSLISTANLSISDIVHDTTGMRRFVQIHSEDKFDHAALNAFDYESFWIAVDESKPLGYLYPACPSWHVLQKHQNDLSVPLTLRDWFDENFRAIPSLPPLYADAKSLGQEVSDDDLFSMYTSSLELKKLIPLSQPKFARCLTALGARLYINHKKPLRILQSA
jgi:hypothetical protein